MRRPLTAVAVTGLVLAASACASSGALQETEQTLVAELHELQDGQDSLQAELDRVRLTLLDSLQARQDRELAGRGELGRRLERMEEELGRIAALVGAAQRQITRLSEDASGAGTDGTGDPARDTADAESPDGADADVEQTGENGDPRQLYEASLQQFRRGAYSTARSGLEEFLSQFSDHELAPDAQFYMAESWAEAGEPSEALDAYGRVVELYPDSRRAAAALYKSGLLELERGNVEDARVFFSRVVNGYPDSPEASLASDRVEDLGEGG